MIWPVSVRSSESLPSVLFCMRKGARSIVPLKSFTCFAHEKTTIRELLTHTWAGSLLSPTDHLMTVENSLENLQLKEDKSFITPTSIFFCWAFVEDRFHCSLIVYLKSWSLHLEDDETRFGPVERRCQRSVACFWKCLRIPKREYWAMREVLDFFNCCWSRASIIWRMICAVTCLRICAWRGKTRASDGIEVIADHTAILEPFTMYNRKRQEAVDLLSNEFMRLTNGPNGS